jgi:hypothetical protein
MGALMMLRNGFVSNSSSSSFVVYGTQLKLEDLIKKFPDTWKDYGEGDEYDFVEFLFENFEYYYDSDYDEGTIYVGNPYISIGENETAGQFKERTQKELEAILNEPVKCQLFNAVENSGGGLEF